MNGDKQINLIYKINPISNIYQICRRTEGYEEKDKEIKKSKGHKEKRRI